MRLWWLQSLSGINAVRLATRRVSRFAPLNLLDTAAGAIPDPPARQVVAGVVHAHTRYSDGRGSVRDVVEAARAAGARFAILADHDTLQPMSDGWSGYWGSTLLIVGVEIRSDRGYLLALGLPPDFQVPDRSSDAMLDAIQRAGGLAFAIHPTHPYLGWDNWDHAGLTGLEVMNLHGLSRQAASIPALLSFGMHYMRRKRQSAMDLLAIRPDGELSRWDQLLAHRRIAGLASADAHGHIRFGRGYLEAPTYEESFRLVQTQLVLREPLSGGQAEDQEIVLRALRDGRCRLAYAHRGDASRFSFYYYGGGTYATEGEEVIQDPGGMICVDCPVDRATHRLFRNGVPAGAGEGRRVAFKITAPGAYRLETDLYDFSRGRLRFGVRPWLFSNPIYVRAAV